MLQLLEGRNCVLGLLASSLLTEELVTEITNGVAVVDGHEVTPLLDAVVGDRDEIY